MTTRSKRKWDELEKSKEEKRRSVKCRFPDSVRYMDQRIQECINGLVYNYHHIRAKSRKKTRSELWDECDKNKGILFFVTQDNWVIEEDIHPCVEEMEHLCAFQMDGWETIQVDKKLAGHPLMPGNGLFVVSSPPRKDVTQKSLDAIACILPDDATPSKLFIDSRLFDNKHNTGFEEFDTSRTLDIYKMERKIYK